MTCPDRARCVWGHPLIIGDDDLAFCPECGPTRHARQARRGYCPDHARCMWGHQLIISDGDPAFCPECGYDVMPDGACRCHPPTPPEPEGDVLMVDCGGAIWRPQWHPRPDVERVWENPDHAPRSWRALNAERGPLTIYRAES